jgi:signal transduction histidine kinase/ligand-binding sensor domain-containing protein
MHARQYRRALASAVAGRASVALLGGAVLWGAVLCAPSTLPAQPRRARAPVLEMVPELSVRSWGIEEGLPQGSVTELVLDQDGYVWGATFGGLFRFDGRNVRSFTSKEIPAISANAITALTVAPDGMLYFGTPAGTVGRVWRGRLVDTVPPPPKDGTSSIDQLLVDAAGSLWLRAGDSVYVRTGGRWQAHARAHSAYSHLALDSTGAVLFSGMQGLVRATVHDERVLVTPAVRAAGHTVALHRDRNQRVWIGEPDGLHVWDAARGLASVPGITGAANAVVTDSNIVWVAAANRLYRLRTSAPTALSEPAQLMLTARTDIVSLLVSRDGVLIAGTLDGLLAIVPNVVGVIEHPTGLAPEAASLAAVGDGTVWVTGGCTPPMRLDGAGRVLETVPPYGPSGCTRSLALDARGRLWIGNAGGLRRRETDGGLREWTLPPGINAPNDARPIIVAGDTAWFGLSDGRIGRIVQDGPVTIEPAWTTVTGVAIQSLARGVDGSLWVGQLGTLSRSRRDRVEHFGRADGMPHVVPRALLTDTRGGIWVGTYGSGLLYFRPGARVRIAPLRDETVSALLRDADGRLWMPGNRGLSVASLSSLARWVDDSNETPDVRLLTGAEGVPEANAGYPAAAAISGASLAFAGVSGLVIVNREGLPQGGITPTVLIDDVRSLNGERFDATQPIVLQADDRVLHIAFSAPAFRYAEEVQFRYRLHGQSWIPLGSARELQLAGLPAGAVTVDIAARVPGGSWRDASPIHVEFVPTFLERPLTRLLATLSIVALLALFFRQRLHTVRADARAQQIAMQARRDAAAIADRHQREITQVSRVAVAGELTASLSHELGQPLAAIVNNAEVARRLLLRHAERHGADDPMIDEALRDVVVQGRRASQVVREFRRFLRREQGVRETLNVGELLESSVTLVRQEFGDANVALDVSVLGGALTIRAERVLLQQVFVNLLQNALEAVRGRADGRVLLRARGVGTGVRISVSDNGNGFAPDVRRTAFEPFVTSRANGMGMGLAIVRRIVEAHGGHVGAGRLPSAGAVISLWLPSVHVTADKSDTLVPLQVTTHG